MKTTVLNEVEKKEFIQAVEKIEVRGAFRAEFSKIKRKRSLSANAYMWLCLTIAEQETGNARMDLYLYFLAQYPTTKEVDISGEVHLVPVSSSQFNTSQMSVFIDNIRRELFQIGVSTPDINDDRAIDAYNYYNERGLI